MTTRTLLLLNAALAIGAVNACDRGMAAAGDGWEATVDTIGDTIVVRTLAGSVWPDTVTLSPELTIGVLEGPEEQMFGEVRAIAVTSAGEILVLDRHVPTVRRFGPDGAYLGSWGRDGAGPGELRRPEAMSLLPDGRVLVRDPGNARVTVFGPDGSVLPSWPLPSGGGFSTSNPMVVDTAGNSYTMVLMQMGVAVTEWKYGLAKFEPDGTHRDTVPVPEWDFDPWVVTASREGSSSSTSVPFGPGAEWEFSPLGYFVGGVSTDYRIDLLRDPRPRLRIERAWTPIPVLGGERAERERVITENFKQNYGTWRWNGPAIPDTKAAFDGLMVAADGRIWVNVPAPAYEALTEAEAQAEEERSGEVELRFREPDVFDVFEPDGRYLGVVKMPEEFRTFPRPVLRGNHAWAVSRDELDVQRVVRYRIVVPDRP